MEGALGMAQQYLDRATKELTQSQLKWSPGPEANHIGWVYLHMAQVEDLVGTWISGRAKQVWETGNWAATMGLAPDIRIGGMKPAEAVAFTPPPLQGIRDYHAAVRAETLACLRTLKEADLERPVRPDRPEFTVTRSLNLLLSELFQHVGQIGYIRGLIDQNKVL
jgi:hypothetical protein